MSDRARRAVACKGFRPRAGMLWLWHGGGSSRLTTPDGFVGDGGEPDLDDPATLGCLLALVRKAWGCDNFRRLTIEPAGAGWCVLVRNGRHRPPSRSQPAWVLDRVAHQPMSKSPGSLGDNTFPTEAEALVAALEAAP